MSFAAVKSLAILERRSTMGRATALELSDRCASLAHRGLAFAWLLDPGQSWVSGQVSVVGGGMSCVQPNPRLGAARR